MASSMREAAVALCVLGALSPPARAGDPVATAGDATREGQRVRLWAEAADAAKRLEGEPATVVRSDAHAITVSVGGGRRLVTVPYSAIRQFQVSEGRHRRTGHGAIIGAILGLTAALMADELRGSGFRGDVADPVFATLGAGGLGAGIGATMKTERWRPQEWPSALSSGSSCVRLGFRF